MPRDRKCEEDWNDYPPLFTDKNYKEGDYETWEERNERKLKIEAERSAPTHGDIDIEIWRRLDWPGKPLRRDSGDYGSPKGIQILPPIYSVSVDHMD